MAYLDKEALKRIKKDYSNLYKNKPVKDNNVNNEGKDGNALPSNVSATFIDSKDRNTTKTIDNTKDNKVLITKANLSTNTNKEKDKKLRVPFALQHVNLDSVMPSYEKANTLSIKDSVDSILDSIPTITDISPQKVYKKPLNTVNESDTLDNSIDISSSLIENALSTYKISDDEAENYLATLNCDTEDDDEVNLLDENQKPKIIYEKRLYTNDDKFLISGIDAYYKLSLNNVLWETGVLSKILSDYEIRSGQLQIANDFLNSYINKNILVCEAGTGTGKTFSYLIPAILSDAKLIVSTGTKALQDQIVKNDLPRLSKLLNVKEDFVVLKGRSNYLCKYRFEQFYKETKVLEDDLFSNNNANLDLDSIKDALYNFDAIETSRYLKKDLNGNLPGELNKLRHLGSSIINNVCADADLCNKASCPYKSDCYWYRNLAIANNKKIAVLNHSLYFHFKAIEDDNDGIVSLLPKHDAIVFDEAHNIASKVAEPYSYSFSSKELQRIKFLIDFACKSYIYQDESLKSKQDQENKQNKERYNNKRVRYINKVFDNLQEKLKACAEPIMALYKSIYYVGVTLKTTSFEFFDLVFKNYDDLRSFEEQAENLEFKEKMIVFYKSYNELKNAIVPVVEFIKKENPQDEDSLDKLSKAKKKIIFNLFLVTFLMKKGERLDINRLPLMFKIFENHPLCHYDFEDFAICVETTSALKPWPTFKINVIPIDTSKILHDIFFDLSYRQKIATTLCSATISINKKFDRFIANNGLYGFDNLQTRVIDAVFDYQKQARLLVSDKFPYEKQENRTEGILSMLLPIINNTNGGIFYLATSYKEIRTALEILSRTIKNRPIFTQDPSKSLIKQLKDFKDSKNGIFVGTMSLWEGVDIKGQALSLVIIDKLPFANISDPYIKARTRHYGNASFCRFTMPEAIISLRQGVGRLIRSTKDYGGIIICDPRLINKGYGAKFLESLPPIPRVNSQEMLLYLKNIYKNN